MGDSHEFLQKRFEAVLREKEALETIIETIEDGFIETDLKGNITRFNKAFCELSGYPPEEADGLSYRSYMDAQEAEKVYTTFNRVFRTGIANKAFDHEVIRKDGARRIVEISITPIRPDGGAVAGFRCIMRDVTLRKATQEALVAQRSRLAAIFRSVEDAIVTVDPELNVIEANAAAEKMCGLRPETFPSAFVCHKKDECSQACRDVLRETLGSRVAIRHQQVSCGRSNAPFQKVSLSSAPLEDQSGAFLGAVLVIRDITRLTNLERELRQRHEFHRIIGKSEKMQEIYRLIEDISDFEATVLLRGESGTGKELVARAIHNSGSRRFKPFVTVNCSALAEPLLESELFGHVKGAFTGAIRDHIGRFQAADGGTLLLDEIGDISPVIQLKLLRVLQEKEIERVGESHSTRIDVRVIAATHKDLKEKVRRSEFREDLFYRLNVLEIDLPPLRDRLEDLPLLVDHFLSRFERKFNAPVGGLSDAVMNIFMQYAWPGNVRELEHGIERAVILSRGGLILPEHLPVDMRERKKSGSRPPVPRKTEEPAAIVKALAATDWNKAKAARQLGISRKTLYQKIRKHGIPNERPEHL